ncbi:hypothetical protein ACHWQZ_G016857 [Mnemiopsis leidyi]
MKATPQDTMTSPDHQFYNTPTSSIQENISTLTTLHPSLQQLGDLPCVVHAARDPSKVALICGGGSGHEPAHGGYVGQGMLSGAVAGNVFASPSSSLVLELILEVTGEPGCLVIVKNYTGDCLNFGIAVEKAKKMGRKVEMVICADDTTLLNQDTLAGPRGLCGVLFVQKIAGACAAQGHSLQTVYNVAQLVTKNIGTAGVAVSPCIPPGKPPSFTLPPNTMEFGIGIHGEAGVLQCGSVDCKSSVDKLFSYLSDVRGLGLKSGDDVAVIVNNLGGTSELEMGVVCQEVLKWLKLRHVTCYQFYSGVYMTSLGMHGISISVLRLDQEGRFLEFLKYPTSAPYWKPGTHQPQIPPVSPYEPQVARHVPKPGCSNNRLSKILSAVYKDLLSKVGELDELDRHVGDGDCGSTVEGVVRELQSRTPSLEFSSFSFLLTQLSDVVEEHMGGTSGAIYTIGLTAAAGQARLSGDPGCEEVTVEVLAKCLEGALCAVTRYGKAEEGDCTMLDVLYPVCRVLQLNSSADMTTVTALCTQAADTGVMKTAELKPRAGRASYIRSEETDKCADPGAVAAATWVKAICKCFYLDDL